MKLQYVSGQTFKEFYRMNLEPFKQQFLDGLAEQFSIFKKFVTTNSSYMQFWEAFSHSMELLNDEKYEEIIEGGFERGRLAAHNDVPMETIMTVLLSFRRTYWDFVEQYCQHAELSVAEVMAWEKRVNYSLDTLFRNYVSAYVDYQREVQEAQQKTIEELSVPVIPLDDHMAVMPLVGTIDTYRAKNVQENLLRNVSEHKITRIIIDLSGVPMVDTSVAGHLFGLLEALRLLGCETTISGIRPEIASTIVELGIEFAQDIEVKRTLKQALSKYYVG
ncbi:MAG TPA: STAS domain-containing protein [Bacilli bacterium]|nr:STAS domain-containing protein [Bacilli bacterium]